ncbi:MAG: DNA polymerase I [Parcubacteria group bacterium Gr01-1014_44]|nr:MAG: DNA polymerase I [Parcubacteria group bacterium Gr01-1014_44]
MHKLILIDANALVHRAFHALPPLTSPEGMVVNAVYGFTSVLIKAIKDMKPDYMAAAFDLPGPTFRHEEYEEYKAHRQKAPDELYAQIPLIKDMLRAFGVEIFEQAGFEADDLIGSVAEEAKKIKDLQTVILTGDLDTLQLVDDDKVLVLTLRKGVSDTILYDEKAVKDRYGLEPYQVTDFKGLKGDPSDNIPGVPGIGDKTATALLQEYETIENLYKELGKKTEFKKATERERGSTEASRPNVGALTPKLAEKLKEHEKQAIFSKRLATIIRDVKIDFSLKGIDWQEKLNQEEIIRLLKNLGFNSLLGRLNIIEARPQQILEEVSPENATKQAELGLNIIEARPQQILEFLEKIKKGEPLYLAYDNGHFYFLRNGDKEVISVPVNLIKSFRPIFEDPEVPKRGYNLKPLIKVLLERGLHLKNIDFDIVLAVYLAWSETRDYAINKVYFNEFGQSLADGPVAAITALPKLYEVFWDKLKSKNLTKVLYDIELPLVPVLAEMEKNGIKIDLDMLKNLSQKVDKEITGLEKKIYELAGEEFNINSPQQLGVILYDKLLLKTKVRKTLGGARSTAVSELEKLRDEHPIVELIMQYRELQKLKTTYIEPFPALVDPRDRRVHTTYNQMGTVTGRLSSQDPNLQNIPVRTELGQEFRRAFTAEEGYELVSLDYSQLELRIAAFLSGDQKMLEAFRRGEDIHTRTAAEIFEVPSEQVTPHMRREAKALNFGILYGMGIMGFARSAGVDRLRAREFITKYFQEFSGMARYIEKLKEQARQNGFVETYFGRRRELPEINSGLPQLVAQAERMASNAPIQGTEADIMKLAMAQVCDYIHKQQNEKEAKILLQVHDELLCEIKKEKSRELALKFKEIMENIWKVDVPIIVDVKVGDNWAEMRYI